MRRRILLKFLLMWVIGGFVLLVVYSATHQAGFLHAIGVEPRTPGTTYNFWSGFGSDLGEYSIAFAVLSSALGAYRTYRKHHECHIEEPENCHRLGLHTVHVPGGEFKVCRDHHRQVSPNHDTPITVEHIAKHHALHLAQLGHQKEPAQQ